MTTITTTANGTYTDCGFAQPVGLTLTCSGASCSILSSFPGLSCQQDTASSTSSCSNGITCPTQPNFVSQFQIAQSSDNTVKSSQSLTIDDEGFSGTDNNGVVAYSALSAGPQPSTAFPGGPGPGPGESPSGTNGRGPQTSVIVVTTVPGGGATSSSTLPLQTGKAACERPISKMLLVIMIILSIFAGQIQGFSALRMPRNGGGLMQLSALLFLRSHILPLVLAQELQPSALCPPAGGNYCDGPFTNIILRCTPAANGSLYLQPGNCNDNLAGLCPVGVKTNAVCGNSTANNADCYIPPYPPFIHVPPGVEVAPPPASCISTTSTTASYDCEVTGVVASLSNSFTDTTGAATVTIVETYAAIAFTSCPVSFTASQIIKAGGLSFVDVQVITLEAQGQSNQVTFAYSGLPHSALRTLGPTIEVSEYWVPTGAFNGGGDTFIVIPTPPNVISSPTTTSSSSRSTSRSTPTSPSTSSSQPSPTLPPSPTSQPSPSTTNSLAPVVSSIDALFPPGNDALLQQVQSALCQQVVIGVINQVTSGQISRASGVTSLVQSCLQLIDSGEPKVSQGSNAQTVFELALGNLVLCDKLANTFLEGTLTPGRSLLCEAIP